LGFALYNGVLDGWIGQLPEQNQAVIKTLSAKASFFDGTRP